MRVDYRQSIRPKSEIGSMTSRNDRILLWLSTLLRKIGLFLLAVQEEIDK